MDASSFLISHAFGASLDHTGTVTSNNILYKNSTETTDYLDKSLLFFIATNKSFEKKWVPDQILFGWCQSWVFFNYVFNYLGISEDSY